MRGCVATTYRTVGKCFINIGLLVFELIAAGCWPLSNKARVLFWVGWSEVVVVVVVVLLLVRSNSMWPSFRSVVRTLIVAVRVRTIKC